MEQQPLNVAEISVSYTPTKTDEVIITTSWEANAVFRRFFSEDTMCLQEQFMVMYMNKAHLVIGIFPMSIGGITATIADIRLILAVALKVAATSIMLAHNHPSGSLKPSFNDIELTNRVKEAALLMDITLIDHLILAPDEGQYYSFADGDGL